MHDTVHRLCRLDRLRNEFPDFSHLQMADVRQDIAFSCADFRTLQPTSDAGLVICNPPYGQRLGSNARKIYRDLGHVLQDRFESWRRIVLVPDAACEHALGLPARRRLAFRHGGRRIHALDLA